MRFGRFGWVFPFPLVFVCLLLATLTGSGAAHAEILVSSWEGRIARFDQSTGAYLGDLSLSGPISSNEGIEYGPDGKLYVTEYSANRVRRFLADGTVDVNYSCTVTQPSNIAFDSAGNVYVTASNRLYRCTPNGTVIGEEVGAGWTNGAVQPRLGPDGYIYITNYTAQNVIRLRPDGSDPSVVVTFGFRPFGLDVGPNGDLYVSSYGTNEVWRWNRSQGLSLVANVVAPYGVRLDTATGDVLVGTGDYEAWFYRIHPNGTYDQVRTNLLVAPWVTTTASLTSTSSIAADWGPVGPDWASTATNPNGAWSYGYWTNAAGPTGFTLLPVPFRELSTYGSSTDVYDWLITRTQNDTIIFFNNGPYAPDNSFFGAPTQQYAVGFYAGDPGLTTAARWTVPATGSYTISGTFYGIAPSLGGVSSAGAAMDVAVYVDGVSMFASQVTSGGPNRPFAFTASLGAGQVVDFAESRSPSATGSQGWFYGNQVDATIVPGAASPDSTPPALTLPGNIIAEATSAAGASVSFTATATDAVDGPRPVSCSPASGATFPLGRTTVTCSAGDTHGNTAIGSFTVSVRDTTGPTLMLPGNLTQEATSASGATVTYTASATDAVDGAVAVACVPASGSTFPIAVTTVSCSATDAQGNTGTGSFNVTIRDNTPPTLTVPTGLTSEATSAAGAVVTYAATASDGVDGALAVACMPPSGSTFAFGTTTVGCSAADSRGNTATATFTVTVQDTGTPVLTLPANIMVQATGTSGVMVSYAASASDAVDGPVTVTCSPASGSTFPFGRTVVACSAADAHGNVATGTFAVTVAAAGAPPNLLVFSADSSGTIWRIDEYTASGQFVANFQSSVRTPGYRANLGNPRVGPDGNVYVSFGNSAAVLVFDGRDGTLLRTLPVPAPADLGFDCAGNLYVVEELNRVVDKFTPDGVLVRQFGPLAALYALGLAVRDNGNLLVTSYLSSTGTGQVQEISGDSGAVVETWALPGYSYGVQIGPDGRTYVALFGGAASLPSSDIYTLRAGAPPTLFASQATAPHLGDNFFLTFSGDHLFVTTYDQGLVVEVDGAGAEVSSFATQQSYALGITTRPSGGGAGSCSGNGPTITGFSPTSGGGGTSVTISGTNFTGATVVRFNGTSAIYVVDSTTQITATVPVGATTGPIAVTTPSGTAISAAAFAIPGPQLYVADYYGNTIEVFTPNGAGSVFASTGVLGPVGLAFDHAGNLFVADYGANDGTTIAKLTPDGVASVFATGLSLPVGLAFDGPGNLYVSNIGNNTIMKFTPDGVGSLFASTGLNTPYGLAFDSAGNLYVANWGDSTILKLTPGGVGSIFANTGLSLPQGLAFDSAGNLFATNHGNNTITKFTPAGVGSLFASGLDNPYGLAFDSAGNLFVANLYSTRIMKYTPDGTPFLFATASSGTTFLAFAPSGGAPPPDTTPPVLTLPANITAEATSGAGAPVTFTATAVDAIDGPAPVTCTPASGSTFPIGATTVSCSASDTHGNAASGSFTVTVRDTTPPTVSITTPAAGAVYTVGQAVTASYSCADTASGVASCAGPVPSGGNVDTASGGTFTFTVNATDQAGNPASNSVNYSVIRFDSTTTITSSLSTATVAGQAYTVAVSVTVPPGGGTPTGSVTVSDGTGATCTIGALAGGSGSCSLASTSAGTKTITAVYGGDGRFNPSTSAGVSHVVNKVSTTTTLSSSANPSVFGQAATFTATVRANPPGVGAPTGTVTFRDGSTTLGTGTLNGAGQATFTSSTLGVGAHSITAVYGGDTSFNTSTSAALAQTVSADGTSTIVTASANPSVFGQAVTFTATVTASAPGAGTPGGTVTFRDGATTLGTRTLNASGQATFATSTLSLGTHTITASYNGSGSFSASTSATLTQTVSADGTSTIVTASANPSVFGQAVTFTATVTASAPGAGTPTGTVTFQDGTTPLGTGTLNASGHATFTTSTLSVGAHAVTASYNASGNFGASTSAALTLTVNTASTTTTTAASPTNSVFGRAVTFTATVTASAPGAGTPTGTVTFFDGTTTLGTGTVNAARQATFTTALLAVGTHSITAVYGGDSNFSTSTSAASSETVNKASTATTVASSANPSVFGQAVTLTATVTVNAPGAGTPTGTVTFRDGATSLGTGTLNVSGQATFTTSTLAAGSRSITAVYGGDSSFSASMSAAMTETVNKATTATTVASSANPSVFGQAVTFTAAVTEIVPGAAPGGTVTFRDGTTTLGTGTLNASGQATFTTATLSVTSHSITASYGGDSSFGASASAALAQMVAPASTSTTVTTPVTLSAFGQAVTFTATVMAGAPGAGTPTGTVTFQDGTTTLGTGTLNAARQATFTTSALSAGAHAVTASYNGSGNFGASTSAALTQTVTPASTTTTITSSPSSSVSGRAVTFTATVRVSAPGAGTPTGTVTFLDGTTTLGTGTLNAARQAMFATTLLAVGTHSITAVYGGDSSFNASTSSALTETVNKAATATTVTSPVNPSAIGQAVTFTATVTVSAPGAGTPTGTVTFRDGATTLGTGTLNGSGQATYTTSTLSARAHSIRAVYGGDGSFNSSTSPILSQTVQ
jgi:hypothetical protein